VFVTVYVPYAYLELGIGATGLGVTSALAGVGALLGSSASELLGRRLGVPGTIAGSRVVEAGGIAVIAAAASTEGTAVVVVAAAGQLMYGLGFGAEGPIELAYRQAVTPDRLQGRTNATMRSLNRAAVVVGAPLGGLLADAAGLGPALWLGSAGITTAALLLAISGFRAASYDDQPPAESAPSAQFE
jgi:MFS family permease